MIKKDNNSISSVYDETTVIGKIYKGIVKLYESWRKLLASGIPPLTLLKCKQANLVDYKVYGESIQEGENLFNPSTTLTEGIYLNNTGTEVSNTSWRVTDYIEVNGYSFTLTNVGGNAPSICAYDENKNFITGVNYGTENANTKTSVTITSTTLIKYIRFSVYHVWVTDNSVNNIKLLYVPTPETPIEVESVGVKTKNLLPINDNYTTEMKGATLTIEKDVITLNGTINVNSQWGIYQENGKLNSTTAVIGTEKDTPNLMKLKAGKYTMSLKCLSGTFETEGSTNIYFGLYTRKNGTNLIDQRTSLTKTDKTFRFTISEDVDVQFLVIQLVGQTYPITFNDFKFKLQLEEGTTSVIDYEPYGYKIPITVRDENIYDYTKPYIENGTVVEQLENGAILKGNYGTSDFAWSCGWYMPARNSSSGNAMKLKAGDVITISANVTLLEVGNPELTKGVRIYLSTREQVSGAGSSLTDTDMLQLNNKTRISRTFTIPEVGDGLTYYFSITLNSMTIKVEDISVTYGKTITTNIYLKEPLRKLGDYADYIDFENQKVVRNITEYIVPSDIVWDAELGDSYNLIRFRIAQKQIVGQKIPFTEQKCNYALCNEQTTSNSVQGVSVYYSTSLGGTYFRARNTTDFSSPAEYRAFVKSCSVNGKPFKVYFDSYEPTYETITLPNIPTHKGTTIIEVDTTITPSNMEVTYLGKK